MRRLAIAASVLTRTWYMPQPISAANARRHTSAVLARSGRALRTRRELCTGYSSLARSAPHPPTFRACRAPRLRLRRFGRRSARVQRLRYVTATTQPAHSAPGRCMAYGDGRNCVRLIATIKESRQPRNKERNERNERNKERNERNERNERRSVAHCWADRRYVQYKTVCLLHALASMRVVGSTTVVGL